MIRSIRSFIKTLLAPNSLQFQLLARSLLILAVLLVLIGLVQYVFMKEVIYRNKAASLQGQVMSIPYHAWEQFTTQRDENRLRPPLLFIPEASLAFIDQEGKYSTISNGPGDMNPARLDTQEYLKVMDDSPRPELLYQVIENAGVEQLVVLQPVMVPFGKALGVVQISTLTLPLKELLIRQLLTFLVLSLFAMIMGLLGFLPVLKRTLIPLFNMVETAQQIDAGNLDRRFPTRQGQMEIDRLADSFNGMLARLEASFEAERETKEMMRRFVADASHELRTPLTSIHGFLEVLIRGAVNQPDQLHKALKSMHSESERLNKLVHDLLFLAKLDQTPHIELKEDSLDEVIQEMEPQLRILAGNRNLGITLEPNVRCKFDRDKMKQVILNLFHNAVQHTDPETGCMEIQLGRRRKGIQLSIQDNGEGISAIHLPHVFERFYRSDSSRTRTYGGAGLGLSITKSIVEIHGGHISVECKEGEGCRFLVWLPA